MEHGNLTRWPINFQPIDGFPLPQADLNQPLGKVWLPLYKHVGWFGEWRYYGYGEAFYLYEGFRAHLVTTGLRFTP